MNYKNVKELKEKIEAEVKEDFDFEQHLFKKYPDLFVKGEDGELLPQIQRCWNDCPKGWEALVDALFGCIDDYIKNSTITKINPKKKIKAWVYQNIWVKMQAHIERIFNPYNNKIPFNTPEQRVKRDKLFSMKVRRWASRVRAWFLSELYTYNNPKQAKIGQYKEKFGSLRIYADSADKTVDGMIRFAEYLSSNICQNTGKSGSLRNVGGWYITLSEEEYAQIKRKL